VNEHELPTPDAPVADVPAVVTPSEMQSETQSETPVEAPAPAVDPVRSAAGRLGGQRVHRLAELGREYEREHGLTPGRQRLKQLIQLGKRYEIEHGLRAPKPRRRRKGNAWAEFLTALARVVQPKYRPAVEQLVASLRPGPTGIAA